APHHVRALDPQLAHLAGREHALRIVERDHLDHDSRQRQADRSRFRPSVERRRGCSRRRLGHPQPLVSGRPSTRWQRSATATGIDVANIPYKSGTQAVPDMLGGRIDINFGTLSNLLPLIREGKVRALAVTSEARSPDLPDVPTMAQSDSLS